MIVDMSFSLILRLHNLLSVRGGRGGNLFKLLRGVHWSVKNLLKWSAFSEKFVMMSPFTRRGGIAGIFLLFRKRFSIGQ